MKFKYLIGLLAGIFMLPACNTDGPGGSGESNYIDIATLESNGASGAVFSLRQINDSPIVTLLSTRPLNDEDFTVGDRVVIQYTSQKGPYESGNITLTGISNTLGRGAAAPDSTAAETSNWASAKVDIRAAWRTGEYLNMQFMAESAGEPLYCDVVFDEATLATEYPTAHFIFRGAPGSMSRAYVFYGSFNIQKYWQLPGIKGIRLLYKDVNSVTSGDTPITIIKEKSEITPTE